MRERTFSRASSCSGSAEGLSFMVTRAPPPSRGSTLVTLPTSTPAIRTGERAARLDTCANSACTVWLFSNGFSRNQPTVLAVTRITMVSSAGAEARQPLLLPAPHGTSFRLSIPSSRDL